MKVTKRVPIVVICIAILLIALAIFNLNRKSDDIISDYDYLEIFTLENVQSGDKKAMTITDQNEILNIAKFLESGSIKENAEETAEKTKPYYYRFYKGEEIAKEYVFQNNNFEHMYTDDGLKTVEYTENAPNIEFVPE